MKKILIRVLIIVLAVLLAAGIAIYFLVFHEPDDPDVRQTVTDANGNAYLAATDENGSTVAVVEDENGDLWEVGVNGDGSLGTTGDKVNDKYDKKDVLTTYAGPSIDETVDGSAYTGEAESSAAPNTTESTTAATTQGSQTTAQSTTQSTAAPANEPNILRYQKMFNSGTYLMEFTTNDSDMGSDPITTASKNGNLIITAKMENMSVSMLYLANKDKNYMLLHDFRKYCSVPQSMLGDDFNMSEANLMENFASDVEASEIKTEQVTLNGKAVTCESYNTDDGSKMKYYFDGGTLVRLDNTDADGVTTEIYVSRITSDVPDSTFAIPDNYSYLNLGLLENFIK